MCMLSVVYCIIVSVRLWYGKDEVCAVFLKMLLDSGGKSDLQIPSLTPDHVFYQHL